MAVNDNSVRSGFQPETVLKRDVFSETVTGKLDGGHGKTAVLRNLAKVPFYAKPLALWLARKETRALQAVSGIEGCPTLIHADRDGLLRDWTEGTPLQLARPDQASWYADARRLLRQMRRAGVTHNDIAKPQNWLMTPQGRAAVIDFQLASVHRKKGWIFKTMAREDLRHLMKQKAAYAPHLLTHSQHRLLARKSLPSRIWMATGKRAYNFITRRLMDWSDGEGTEDRLERDGPALQAALTENPEIRDVAICTYALPAKGVGLYAFVETALSQDALNAQSSVSGQDLVQPVNILPRDNAGRPRMDVLQLIASNRLDELREMLNREPQLDPVTKPIIDSRRNLTDRSIKR